MYMYIYIYIIIYLFIYLHRFRCSRAVTPLYRYVGHARPNDLGTKCGSKTRAVTKPTTDPYAHDCSCHDVMIANFNQRNIAFIV